MILSGSWEFVDSGAKKPTADADVAAQVAYLLGREEETRAFQQQTNETLNRSSFYAGCLV
jgi:hypothetical protein